MIPSLEEDDESWKLITFLVMRASISFSEIM
jgi:hypothetical protein